MALETPPRRALGDIAVPSRSRSPAACARRPGPSPRSWPAPSARIDGVARVEAAPNGYLNLFLDRAYWLQTVAGRSSASRRKPQVGRSSDEDHRRAHGDQSEQGGAHRAPAQRDDRRRLRAAAPVPGTRRSRSRTTSTTPASRSPTSSSASASSSRKTSPTVRAIADSTRFDYYCWDLYARVTEWYDGDKSAAEDPQRPRCTRSSTAATTRPRWPRSSPTASSGAISRRWRRLNIRYDLLTWEGDILRLHFWAHAFEFLKKTGEVFLQTEGKLAGCWVMKIDDEHRSARKREAGSRKREAGSGKREAGSRERRTAREGHRPVRRHRDLRRQGHGVPDVEVRPPRSRLLLSRLRASSARGAALVDHVRPGGRRGANIRRSGARRWCATSSTRGRRICRSC